MILVCGEALVDLIASATSASDKIKAQLGGAPFNVAIGLARLGVPVAFVGGISSDAIGTLLLQTLKNESVETKYVRISSLPSMMAIAGVSAAGVPTYSFPIINSADRDIPSDNLILRQKADVSCAVFGSYLAFHPATGPMLFGLARQLCPNAVVCLDPNVRLSLISDPLVWIRGIEQFLPFLDIIKCSEEDISNLYGSSVSVTDVAKEWLRRGVAVVCITRGENGAILYSEDGFTINAPAPTVNVVDTIGAGDSFLAAFLASLHLAKNLRKTTLVKEHALDTAVKFAISAAALTCQRDGADMPRMEHLQF